MAARNRKTRLAALEKTDPSPATLPALQAQAQNSRSKDSIGPRDSHSFILGKQAPMCDGLIERGWALSLFLATPLKIVEPLLSA
jgi:hypothetical protein